MRSGRSCTDERAPAADPLDQAGLPQDLECPLGGDPADLELGRELHLGRHAVAGPQRAAADLLQHVRTELFVEQAG